MIRNFFSVGTNTCVDICVFVCESDCVGVRESIRCVSMLLLPSDARERSIACVRLPGGAACVRVARGDSACVRIGQGC